jgi:hypothetical protein
LQLGINPLSNYISDGDFSLLRALSIINYSYIFIAKYSSERAVERGKLRNELA